MINYALNFAQGVGHGFIDGVNYVLMNAEEDFYTVDVLGMPLSLAMTRYPEFSSAKDEISININGEFVSDIAEQYVTPDSTWVEFEDQTQKEQLWIHQSMINSLLYQVEKTLSGPGFNKQMFSLLAEVYYFYGRDVSCEGVLSFPAEQNSQPVTIDATQGILLGDKTENGLRLNIDMMCA